MKLQYLTIFSSLHGVDHFYYEDYFDILSINYSDENYLLSSMESDFYLYLELYVREHFKEEKDYHILLDVHLHNHFRECLFTDACNFAPPAPFEVCLVFKSTSHHMLISCESSIVWNEL